MTTALGLITSAMKKIKVLTKSETPSSDEAADGLTALNAMLSSWSNDSLLCYARVSESFTLTPGTGTYNIGTSYTFNTARPINIVSAFIRESNTDYPLTIIPDEAYDALPYKTQTSSIPEFLNYVTGFPSGTIRLVDVPSAANSLFLTSEKVLTSFVLSDTVSLPPGWEEALIYNLALRMAPEYDADADALTVKIAQDSLSAIKLTVAKNRPILFEGAAGQKQNIYTGYYG